MKKLYFKNIVALVLTFSLLLSSFVSLQLIPASALEAEAIITDDFEGYGSVNLEDHYETIAMTDNYQVSDLSNNIRISSGNGRNGSAALQNATISDDAGVRQLLTTLKEDYTPKGFIKGYSLYYNCTRAFYDSHLAFVPYYVGKDDFFAIDFQPNSNGIINFRVMGARSSDVKTISKKTDEPINYYDASADNYDPWLNYSFNYEYTFTESSCKLVIYLTVFNSYKTVENYGVYELNGATNAFRTGFTAEWGSSYNDNYIDDIHYDVTPYEELAAEFILKYSEFLNKENPTEADLETYNEVLTAYNSYPAAVRELLANEKALLDAIKEKIIASIPQTKLLSLNSAYYSIAWQNIKVGIRGYDPSTSIILNNSVFTQLDGEEVYKPIVSSEYKSMDAATPVDSIWPIKTLDKTEVSFKISQDGWWDNNPAFYPLMIENKETGYADYIGVQYTASSTSGSFSMRGVYNSDRMTVDNTDLFWNGNTELDTSDWLKMTVEYDYSNFPMAIGLNYTLTDVKGASLSASRKYQIKFDVDICDFNFKIGIGSSCSRGNVYFKDLNLSFSTQDKDLASAFIKKYEQLFAIAEYTPDYEAQVTAMANEFYTHSASVRDMIYKTGRLDNLVALLRTSALADAYNSFYSTYGTLLSKKKLATADVDIVKAALIDYDAENAITKLLLYKEKAQLDMFVTEFDIVREDNDYSSFSYSFDDGINPFREVTAEPTLYAVNEIITDPYDETGENKVLKISGKDDVFLLKYWPSLGVVDTVTFTMKTNSNIYVKSRIFCGYEDSENYYAAAFSMGTPGGTVFGTSIADNVSSGNMQINNVGMDFTQKLEMRLVYSDSSVTVTAKGDDGTSYSWTINYSRGGAFGFGYWSTEGYTGNPMYIDDLNIEFLKEPGDFDTNDPSVNIDVYYTGNTFLKPDDTISLIGNKLWTTAQDEVLISRVEDAEKADLQNIDNQVSVVEQMDYSGLGLNQSDYVATKNHTFDEDNALRAQLLQRSSMAMEAVIPKSFTDGIYTLKLSPKQDEGEVVYLYVNRPEISFVTGDEGNIATRGGRLRIIGNNLVPTGNADDVTVRLISKTDGKNHNLPVTSVYEDDAYSLTVDISDDFPIGEYEVYVHNGYGDNTCWSEAESISVDKSPRENWNQDIIFDVTDETFGAVGDGAANDTPAILKALQAASEVKGTVYFPRGKYRVVTTLAIPEGVTIRGADVDDAIIDFSATTWQYGDCPTLISIIGNTEIRDICFFGTRSQRIIKLADTTGAAYTAEDFSDNVYISNVRMRFTPAIGPLTEGGGYGRPVNGFSYQELYMAVYSEIKNGCQLDLRSGGSNLQVDNMDFEFARNFNAGGSAVPAMMRIRAEQVQIRNSYWSGYSLGSSSYGMIVEDCELQDAAFNPSGNGFYLARNYLHDATANNRELLTTDGKPLHNGINCWFIGERSDIIEQAFGSPETDETIYLLPSVGKQTVNKYVGYNFIVVSGQGVGQVRTITESGTCEITENGKKIQRTWIRVNEPLEISPNRKSKVSISEPRDHWFFIDNEFYEGGASGTYGTMINAVWDGNEFHRHEGQYFNANQSVMWYITLKEQYFYDAAYTLGGLGSTGGFPAAVNKRNYRAILNVGTTKTAFGCLAFTLRECDFSEYGYQITQGVTQESITGFVMEHCTFTDREDNPIVFSTTVNGCGSLLFRDNTFKTVGEFDNITNPDPYAKINSCGYKIIMIVDSEYVADKAKPGDVNLDGKVTIKDCTLIRYYIVGITELDEQQMIRADVNQDEKISLKDVTTIREIILGLFDDEDDSSDPYIDNSGWFDGDF